MLGWRTPWVHTVFFGLLLSLKSSCVRRKDSQSRKQPGRPQARQNQGLFTERNQSHIASHPPMNAIAWAGKQRWLTCLWDLVLLLLQLSLQEALVLGCDLFQLWLEIFWAGRGKQLWSRPGGDLLRQLLSLKQLYSAGQSIITFQLRSFPAFPRGEGSECTWAWIFFSAFKIY